MKESAGFRSASTVGQKGLPNGFVPPQLRSAVAGVRVGRDASARRPESTGPEVRSRTGGGQAPTI